MLLYVHGILLLLLYIIRVISTSQPFSSGLERVRNYIVRIPLRSVQVFSSLFRSFVHVHVSSGFVLFCDLRFNSAGNDSFFVSFWLRRRVRVLCLGVVIQEVEAF